MTDTTNNSTATNGNLGKPPPRWLLKTFTRVNVWVYRMSGGRLMNKLGRDPICLVTMTGAKSGQKRTIPLMYVPYREKVILVASQGGSPNNPVWYHNLVAHPDVVIEQGGKRREMKVRQVSAEEKAELWPTCVEHYSPYETYQQRTQRDIPVFLCEEK